MNYPEHFFGITANSESSMYITTDTLWDTVHTFYIIRPGLTGDPETASLKSMENGKYAVNQNKLLRLKEIDQSVDFKRAATFKIIQDKFVSVSIVYKSTVI